MAQAIERRTFYIPGIKTVNQLKRIHGINRAIDQDEETKYQATARQLGADTLNRFLTDVPVVDPSFPRQVDRFTSDTLGNVVINVSTGNPRGSEIFLSYDAMLDSQPGRMRLTISPPLTPDVKAQFQERGLRSVPKEVILTRHDLAKVSHEISQTPSPVSI